MEPDSEALQGDASASLPPDTEGYPAAAPSDAAAEREPCPNRALGLPYEIIASELAERQQQPAPRGKRSVKSEDADDEPYYPGSSKRSKVAVDSVEPQNLAGNVFLRVDALHPNALVTFDGDLARPLFFEERESGAVEIPGALLGEGVDAMALKMPGVEVELPGGTRRTATVSELINYLKWVFTNGSDAGPDPCVRSTLYGGMMAPAPVMMLIKCDDAPAWLTFKVNNLKAKAVVTKGDRVYEVSPQQFELEAGCHARKWRNSFKVQAALKVIRQGILTPAPYVELHAYLHRLLGLESLEGKNGRLAREASGGPLPPAAAPRGGGGRGSGGGGGAAAFGGMGLPVLWGGAGRGAPLLGLPAAFRPASDGPSGGGAAAAAAEGGLGDAAAAVAAAAAAARRCGGAFIAIPVAPPGRVAGPLTPAEVQAIQAVVSLTEGPKLQWAVQGILQHVWRTHAGGGGTGGEGGGGGADGGSEDGGSGGAGPGAAPAPAPAANGRGAAAAGAGAGSSAGGSDADGEAVG